MVDSACKDAEENCKLNDITNYTVKCSKVKFLHVKHWLIG